MLMEGPERVKWELGFPFFFTGKMRYGPWNRDWDLRHQFCYLQWDLGKY